MAQAYCFRSGEIGIAARKADVPEGAIVFARGSYRRLRDQVEARARHGYADGVLLVPGIPEAADEAAALKALHAFQAWAFPTAPKGLAI